MKIAIIAFSSLPDSVGGVQIFTLNLIKYLLSKGHKVDLYLPKKVAKKLLGSNLINEKNLQIRSIFFSEHFFIRFFPFIIRIIISYYQTKNNYSLWQAIGAYPAGYIISHLRKVPTFLRCHGDDIQKSKKLNYGLRLNRSLELKIIKTLKNIDHLVALTETVKIEYIALGANNQKIKIIPNGINLESFKDKTKMKFFSDQKIKLLTTGRYHKKKGYELIVPCAKQLINRGYNIEWKIIGRNTRLLENLIISNNLENVIFLKENIGVVNQAKNNIQFPSEEMINEYFLSDIYVFPSLLETFGMVLLEAMAAGMPVITTNAPGCRDVVKHRVTGLISKVGDSNDLATNIENIINDKKLRQMLIVNGNKHASNHDWRDVFKKYEELYVSAFHGNGS